MMQDGLCQHKMLRLIFFLRDLYELSPVMQMTVGDLEFRQGKCLEACIKDLVFPAHHMDRQDVPLMLLGIIGFLQDVPGEIALLDGIADHDVLNRFCGCWIAAMTGLNPHAQVVIIFLPSVVFDLKEDPVEQSDFVAVHQLWKDTVVLVDQSEAFAGSCFPVAFH